MERWVTFDCYGTLVDWNGGIGRELERLFGADAAARLLERYHELEPRIQDEQPGLQYRDVLAVGLAGSPTSEGVDLAPGEHGRARALAPRLAGLPGGACRAARKRAGAAAGS